jgi:hypothetical protein
MKYLIILILILANLEGRAQYTGFRYINYYIVNAQTKLKKPEIKDIYKQQKKIYRQLCRLTETKPPEKLNCFILAEGGGYSQGYSFYLDEDRIYDYTHNHIHEMTHTFQRGYSYMPTWYSEAECNLTHLIIGRKLKYFSDEALDKILRTNNTAPDRAFNRVEQWQGRGEFYRESTIILYYLYTHYVKNPKTFLADVRKALQAEKPANDISFIKSLCKATGSYDKAFDFFKEKLKFKSLSTLP